MLTELNEAILELVHRLNDRPFRKLAGSRAELYRLERKYGAERLEAASTRAVRLKLYRFQSVKSMLQSGLDRQPLPELLLMPSPVTHENLRGPEYYAAQETRLEVGQC